MDNPDDPGVQQSGRPARNRVEGRLRFWLCTSIVGFIVSVGLAFLSFCFHLLNVLDTTPPFKTVPLLIWIIMGASLVGSNCVEYHRWEAKIAKSPSNQWVGVGQLISGKLPRHQAGHSCSGYAQSSRFTEEGRRGRHSGSRVVAGAAGDHRSPGTGK